MNPLDLNSIPRRPRVGCSHGDGFEPSEEAQNKAVEGLFRQAIALLPIQEMPELLKCVIGGGACFGLLDPVSNIILSAISYLDRLDNPPSEELARRHGMSIQQQQCEESRNWITDHVDMYFVERVGLKFAASRSRKSLNIFLQSYFRYLTVNQASRYMELANFDLTLAIKLIHYDRFAADPLYVPDPSSSRMQAALKQAAFEARLWAPHDDFVLLATSCYPHDLLQKATAKLLRKEKLSSLNIRQMLKLMDWRSSIVHNTEDLNVAHLIALRHPEDLATKMALCLESMPSITIPWSIGRHNSSSCGYHRGLKLQLLETIHAFYVEALARLPQEFLRKHLRGILMGGHCFGPFDPVSNIILNAVWFERAFRLDCGVEKEADVLDSKCFLRMERRSLEGLIQLIFSSIGGSHDSDGYEQKVLEYLCNKKCEISCELYQATNTLDHETWIQNFISAASAAKHPHSNDLGRFYGALYLTNVGDSMRLLISDKNAISDQELHHLWGLIETVTCHEAPMDLSVDPVNILSPDAWKVFAEKKRDFEVERSFIRNMIDLMLCKYNSSRTAEPMYKLHIICGVSTSTSCSGLMCFHVNFLARTRCQSFGCLLFFSEFFASLTLTEERTSFIHDELRPFFCCPISMSKAFDLGRCCQCEKIGSKILHPSSESYMSSEGEDLTYSFPILNKMDEYAIDIDKALDTEFLYFDHEKDKHLSHLLEETVERNSKAQGCGPPSPPCHMSYLPTAGRYLKDNPAVPQRAPSYGL